MKYGMTGLLVAMSMSVALASCDVRYGSESDGGKTSGSTDPQSAMREAGVMLPDEGGYDVNQSDAVRDERAAAALPGDRGAFQSMHDSGISLNPTPAATGLNLAAAAVEIDAPDVGDGGGDGGGDGQQCQNQQVCAQACAKATAAAYAYAFAHASATTCAWAEAWACVFSFQPFTRVCSWAKSKACATAFASAFGVGFAANTTEVCERQCR